MTEIEVEPSAGEKTRVTLRGFYTPKGWMGRIFNGLFIRRAMRNRARDTVRGFKRLLEGRASPKEWPPPQAV